MSEVNIQNGIATWIRAMSEFADADVAINNWSVLDGESVNAPYVIISNADTFSSVSRSVSPENLWDEAVTLCEWFTDWPTTLNNFRTRRQAIIDAYTAETNAASAGGLSGFQIKAIRSEGGIIAKYPVYNPDGYGPEAIPRWLIQVLLFSCEEF